MKKIFATLAFGLIILSGCSTVGQEITYNDIQNIHGGITTEKELITKFGVPSSQVINSDGSKIYMWTYAHAVAFGPAEGKALSVKINSAGVVESYNLAQTKTQ